MCIRDRLVPVWFSSTTFESCFSSVLLNLSTIPSEWRCRGVFLVFLNPSRRHNSLTVSYTHLDVYKRQEYTRVKIRADSLHECTKRYTALNSKVYIERMFEVTLYATVIFAYILHFLLSLTKTEVSYLNTNHRYIIHDNILLTRISQHHFTVLRTRAMNTEWMN